MKTKSFWISCLRAITVVLMNVQLVLAHESITVGDYEMEVDWLTEPAIMREKNAVTLEVSNTRNGQPVKDITSLTVLVSYGGQRKPLTFQPLGEDTPGQFMAPILPTIPGEYEIILSGSIGDTAVDAET